MRTFVMGSLALFACASAEPQDGIASIPRPGPGMGAPTFHPDSTPDPDPEPSLVTVHVEQDGGPAAAVAVVFQDADGGVRDQAVTGDDGAATGEVAAGAFVTIAWEDGGRHNAVTMAGVQPGDDVTVVLAASAFDPTVGSLRARLPGTVNGAASYTIDLGCSAETVTNPSPPYTLGVRQSCLTGAAESANVFATANDPAGGQLAWSFAGDVAIGASTASVNLPAWSTSWQGVSVELAGAPATARTVLMNADWSVAEGTFPSADEPTAVVSPGSSVTLTTRVPSMAAQGLTSRVIVGHGNGSTLSGLAERIEQHDGVPTMVSLAMVGDFLPAVTAPSLDAASASRPVVGWVAADALDAADVGRIALSWSDAGGQHQWIAWVPPTATAPVTMPALPEELAAWRPTEGATWAQPQVSFFQADWISGYDSVKASGFSDEMPAGAHVLLSTTALNP